jgi:hypothetical protein
MFGYQWYHGTMRKYIVWFGTMFNDIVIPNNARSDTGEVTHQKIPIQYASRDVMIERVKMEENLDPSSQQPQISLPRMSFAVVGYNYDAERAIGVHEKIARKSDDPDKFHVMYTSTPIDIGFRLWIYVDHDEDATKIVEQIYPWFKPEWNATLKIIPELDISIDVPCELTSIAKDEPLEGRFEDGRAIVWTIDFTMRAALFGPKRTKPIIKFANEYFFFGNSAADADDRVAEVLVKPGLDANGQGTSNNDLSVNTHLIEVDDDWDAIIIKSGIQVVFE